MHHKEILDVLSSPKGHRFIVALSLSLALLYTKLHSITLNDKNFDKMIDDSWQRLSVKCLKSRKRGFGRNSANVRRVVA